MWNFQDFVITFAVFAAPIAIAVITIFFCFKYKHYNYVGNSLRFILYAYLICLTFSLIVNLLPLKLDDVKETFTMIKDSGDSVTLELTNTTATYNVNFDNKAIAFFSSFFDAAKMLTLAFDRAAIGPYFDAGGWYFAFGIMYMISSIFALATTALSVVLFRGKSAWAKIKNFFRPLFFRETKHYYFIFSDAKVAGATINLGNVLKAKNNIVIMYVTKASLKTQEGTEYRDMLINHGFDVKSESFSKQLCAFLFKTYFKRKVTIYGLFSEDDVSFKLATDFKDAIIENKKFQEILDSFEKHEWKENENDEKINADYNNIMNFKVFVTYHDYDMDLVSDFSGQTLHIVNTLSQYDMVSSEFVLAYPINRFLDLNKAYEKNEGLHVSFFGFGKINKPIFEKMTYAYQTSEDFTNKVHYHIYDFNATDLVEQLTNEYNGEEIVNDAGCFEKPRLYHLSAECDKKNLTSYEIIQKHFKEKIKNDKNRFTGEGFEIFVVSAAKTNQDIQIAFNLRDIILKLIEHEKLSNTFIFVRISEDSVAKNLTSKNDFIFRKDKETSKQLLELAKTALVPIIIFGEDTNMQTFLEEHYYSIDEKGKIAFGSYEEQQTKPWTTQRENVSWLFKGKKEVINNTSTAFSLEPKLDILGFKINEKGRIVTKDDKAPTGEIIPNDLAYPPSTAQKNEPIYRLAALEHNRWLAANYLLSRHSPAMAVPYYKNNDGKATEIGWSIDSKLNKKTLHICMATNKGLAELYDGSIQNIGGNKEIIKKAAKKLTFENDIDIMRKIFKSMS